MKNTAFINRRAFCLSSALFATGVATSAGAQTRHDALPDLKGSLDATLSGIRPDAYDDQSKAMQRAIETAVAQNKPLFLPGGHYVVSNITLPSNAMIMGVPGLTRLIFSGGGHFLFASDVDRITLEGLVLDGANNGLADYAPALLHLSSATKVHITNCEFVGSTKTGVVLDRVSGRFTGNIISGARSAALQSNEALGLEISGNTISHCADNGILVWRWTKGHDGTLVTNNRISDIGAASGGTGPFGNGINIFRAGNVIVSNNSIERCVFSAIRFNAASNAQVLSNACRDSGEVAIYAEFGFEGALIASNVIDGAGTGISITNFDHGGRLAVAQGNLVRNLRLESTLPTETPTYGIGIAAEADAAISGNVIENAPYAGIALGWGPYLRDVSATGNVIRQSGVGVSVTVVDGAGSAVITDNVIAGSALAAVMGMRWMERATKDLTQITYGMPSHLIVERNRTS
jgi:uncharacterized secreted repeat protein (TIGR03808 family)